MSIGGQNGPETFGVSLPDKVIHTAKKAAESYFHDPIRYLFFGTLPTVIILLLCQVKIVWEAWAILGVFAIVNARDGKIHSFLKKKFFKNKKR